MATSTAYRLGHRDCLDDRVPDRWTLLLPVRLSAPKGRLASLNHAARSALAVAMARDVVNAAQDCPVIGEVIIVGDAAAAEAFADLPCVIDASIGLNAELAAVAAGRSRVAVLLPDVPAVTATDIDWALKVGVQSLRAFVADAEGVGTTLLMTHRGDELNPQFGARSCAAHAVSGAQPIADDVPGRLARLRRDVDDEIGLWDAARLGVGSHTTRLLSPQK